MENAQHIVLRSKVDEYIFAEKNAEFLAAYDTDDKQIDYYTNLAMRVFDEFKIDGDYQFDGVRTNVKTWFNNKRKQIELLRNHPYWLEEAKAIVFLQTETRHVDIPQAGRLLGDLYCYVNHNIDGCLAPALPGAIQSAMFEMKNGEPPIVTKDMIDIITSRVEIDNIHKQIRNCLSVGCRISKLVRKVFEFCKLTSDEIINATIIKSDDSSFDKVYARFSDSLSELTVEKITLLSVHFNDFLLMSNGNSWSSCHFINSHNIFHEHTGQSVRGEYKQGCLSYALDAPSMIFYTLPATYDGEEYYRCPKLARMCCQYENGVLITGKCYPNNEDSLVTRYRNILQQVLSQCGRFPNLWTFSKNTDRISTFAKTASGATHYPDYTYSRQKPTVSLCRNITLDLDNPMEIGHEAYCLYCSDTIDTDRRFWLQCRKHEVKMICSVCGKRIDSLHDIRGAKYCDDCVFFCTWHKRYEPAIDRFNTDKICVAAVIERDIAIRLEEIGLSIVKTEDYNVGDYVLMAEYVGICDYGTSSEMDRHYPNKIVKITQTMGSGYVVSKLPADNTSYTWQWSKNCFAGKVIGATDAHIGKTIEEIRRELTHEA
jgi:hypothetical protein